MLPQKVDTFNNFCDVACLKFKLPCDKTTGYLRTIHCFEGSNATSIRCMSSAFQKVQWWHFFRCGRQVHNHPWNLFRILSTKIIQIGLSLTELFQKCGLFETCTYIYTVSQNVTTLSCYNFDIRESIWMISGINVTEKVSNQTVLNFPTSLKYCFCTTCGNKKPWNCVFSLKCCMLFYQKHETH